MTIPKCGGPDLKRDVRRLAAVRAPLNLFPRAGKQPEEDLNMKATDKLEKDPAAVALGSRTSIKKAQAVRENGKLGGRPRLDVPRCHCQNHTLKTAKARYPASHTADWCVSETNGLRS
jgi:hypothetical protein